jgi:uncharacterized SAM-binding protein YcdF (DUF218 family)
MGFLLKKIVASFLMPLPLFALLFLVGVFYLYRSQLKKAKVLLSLSFLWLFLISYSPLVNSLLYPYENRIASLQHAPKETQYIYVLGGGHHQDDALPIGSQINPVSVIRLNEALRIFHQLHQKPTLILSGYSGRHESISHAKMLEKLALSLGIPKEKIHLEPTPKDTQDEARQAKHYIKDAPFVLVTSASHMPRALAIFHHYGLTPTPAPTNHLAYVAHPNYFDIFSAKALYKATLLWHEILGSLWQAIKGV